MPNGYAPSAGKHPSPMAIVVAAVLWLLSAPDAAHARKQTLCAHDIPQGQSLLIYSGPSKSSATIAGLPADTCDIRLAGRCQGEWCVMAHGATKGWVNTRFIGIYEYPGDSPVQKTEKPAAPVAAKALSATTTVHAPEIVKSPDSSNVAAPVRKPTAARIAAQPAAQKPEESDPGACVVHVRSWDTLRIRRGPGVNHREIGEIPPGACRVRQAGGCRGIWCRIAWRGQVGWVNSYYLD